MPRKPYVNYTEVAILFPSTNDSGKHSGPVTAAAPLVLAPGAQLVLGPHPRIPAEQGALQLSVMRESRPRGGGR